MGNQDDVRRKVFMSKTDPEAALMDLLSLVMQAEDQPDSPRIGISQRQGDGDMKSTPGLRHVPRPGLQGTYDGSCVVCLSPTDTGLVFEGVAEFTIAGLIKLGVPEDEAPATAWQVWGTDPGMVPSGRVLSEVRVCTKDANRAGCQVALLVGGKLPVYRSEEFL